MFSKRRRERTLQELNDEASEVAADMARSGSPPASLPTFVVKLELAVDTWHTEPAELDRVFSVFDALEQKHRDVVAGVLDGSVDAPDHSHAVQAAFRSQAERLRASS